MNPKNSHLEIAKIKNTALAHEIQWRNITEHLRINTPHYDLYLKARSIVELLNGFREAQKIEKPHDD